MVRLFEGSGPTWTAVRVIAGGFGYGGGADGQLLRPSGLRFTGDGLGLVVADSGNDRLSMFSTGDGSFIRHEASGLINPVDVECEGKGAGWLTCTTGVLVEFVKDVAAPRSFILSNFRAVALIPGLLVVRHQTGVDFFASPDAIAMSSMSLCKVAWMTAVCRAY